MVDSFTLYDRNFFDMDQMKTIKDVHLSDYGVYVGKEGGGLWQDILLNNNTHYTQNVQGLNGQIFNGMNFTERKIQIPCYMEGINENKMRDISEILTVIKPLKLQIDRKPYRYIHVVSDGQVDFNYIWHKKKLNYSYEEVYTGLFIVNFVAYNPYYESFFTSLDINATDFKYNDSKFYNDSGLLYGESDTFPSTINITSDSATFQLYNGGNASSKSAIKIKNNGLTAIDNITITNTSNSETFTITTISAGEAIVIDGNKGRITDYPETKLMSSIFKGDFMKIQPKFNTLTFATTDTDTIDLTASFEYRYTYL
jgi:hypothetical protein